MELLLDPSEDGFNDVAIFSDEMTRGVVAVDIDVGDALQQVMLIPIQKDRIFGTPSQQGWSLGVRQILRY